MVDKYYIYLTYILYYKKGRVKFYNPIKWSSFRLLCIRWTSAAFIVFSNITMSHLRESEYFGTLLSLTGGPSQSVRLLL